MSGNTPHYLLLSETHEVNMELSQGGYWRFLLQQLDGPDRFEASDTEIGVQGDRLELLAVIRGLEALDQPSNVTIICSGSYVTHGVQHGLRAWRESEWKWERFGRMHPISNRDLWQRLDRTTAYHEVTCRTSRLDSLAMQAAEQKATLSPSVERSGIGSWLRPRRLADRLAYAWNRSARSLSERSNNSGLIGAGYS